MRRRILGIVNEVMRPFGVFLHRRSRQVRFGMEESLKHLRGKGFHPKTCIDVGVAHGTPSIYEVFPNAKHLLIEPLVEYERDIRKIMEAYDCHYEQAAAGGESGSLDVHVKEQITGSSMFSEQPGTPQGISRTVPVVTLDQVCKTQQMQGPYLVKIDVEGAEMSVLDGAVDIMPETSVFILEITFSTRLVGAPEAGDIISYMAKRDFVIYDLFDLRWKNDETLFQADAVFVPKSSPFRRSTE